MIEIMYWEVGRFMDSLFSGLNEKQKEAVYTTQGPVLVLAGAGSGKTTVLVNRIAYILDKGLANPYQILAITFTNKAANELKSRIAAMIGSMGEGVNAGTFHSECVKILRRYIDRLGYDRSFNIFDRGDQISLIKECLRALNLNDANYPPKAMLSIIGRAKDYLMMPQDFEKTYHSEYRMKQIAKIYHLYQKRLKECNALDFDDIIMQTVRLLEKDEEVLTYYQNKFKYIMVDEYQDTNHAQYRLVSLLAAGWGNICVVGDDDQSIYKFRGADIGNILSFEKEYKNAKVIKLEQNYRSTQTILDAANNVIKNNAGRTGKILWTHQDKGEPILLYEAENEHDEGRFIAEKIDQLNSNENISFKDFAILYRTNSQSRVLEEMLIKSAIPYRIVAGLRFYDRKEIKDVVAYLRTIYNYDDDFSLKRIINEPKRGIGRTTVALIEELAQQNGVSMFNIIQNTASYPQLSRSAAKLRSFAQIILQLHEKMESMDIPSFVKTVMEQTGYISALEQENEVEKNSRLENLGEFISVANEYQYKNEDEPTLGGFLENISLYSDLDDYDEEEDKVVLMTLHSAKGLEFPVVFMPGMEDGLFPNYQSIENDEELEEERRLCYVGITRAKKRLFISYAKSRMLYGKTLYCKPSRFIKEIPMHLCRFKQNTANNPQANQYYQPQNYEKAYGFNAINLNKSNNKDMNYKVGERVKHKKFGVGVILDVQSVGSDQRLEIAFDEVGTKNLMAAYANLSKVG